MMGIGDNWRLDNCALLKRSSDDWVGGQRLRLVSIADVGSWGEGTRSVVDNWSTMTDNWGGILMIVPQRSIVRLGLVNGSMLDVRVSRSSGQELLMMLVSPMVSWSRQGKRSRSLVESSERNWSRKRLMMGNRMLGNAVVADVCGRTVGTVWPIRIGDLAKSSCTSGRHHS